MTLVDKTTGEVVTGDDYLEALASQIREEYQRGKAAANDAVESSLAIGRCLLDARTAMASNDAFGAWFRAQEFPFSQQWAHTLRSAAENEQAFRAAITTQVVNAGAPNIKQAVKQVTAGTNGKRRKGKGDVSSDVLSRLQSRADEDKPEPFKSQRAVRKREAVLAELAAEGHSSRQIAKQLGITRETVKDMAKRTGVEIPADAVSSQGHVVDSERVIEETVQSLEGLCMGLKLVDYDALDRSETVTPDLMVHWLDSLQSSRTVLADVASRLKEIMQ